MNCLWGRMPHELPDGMNWLRHELQLRLHELRCGALEAIQFMERSEKSCCKAAIHDPKGQFIKTHQITTAPPASHRRGAGNELPGGMNCGEYRMNCSPGCMNCAAAHWEAIQFMERSEKSCCKAAIHDP
ncbi:MAG: hypothetical protein IJA48_05610 [Oscillospiraceae bacterium]|nr:hypothetical protein [Oscillospiraceae bacterium]